MADKTKKNESAFDAIKKRVWLEKSFGVEGVYRKKAARKPSQTADERSRRQAALDEIAAEVAACHRCPLYEQATNPVFGVGNPCAELMFIGEGPGADEDAQGEPFVGRAGQLLTKIIKAMGMERGDVYIANVVKHRPPGNRTPTNFEIGQCHGYLVRQLEIIKPKIICALGLPASQTILKSEMSIGSLRGRFQPYPDNPEIKVMPSYHTAYLLRNPADKGKVWDDMKKILAELGRPVPKTGT
jgi:DNA polymerase